MELREYRIEDYEIRSDGDGRTLEGICVPFDTETRIGNRYTEVIRRGAFAKTTQERAQRVKLLAMHDGQRLPLGAAQRLQETDKGLLGEFRVSKTAAGDEALELVRDGALDSFSIGFVPLRDNWNADKTYVERAEVKLLEVSLVAFPAYEDAKVLALRDNDNTHQPKGMSLDLARRIAVTL